MMLLDFLILVIVFIAAGSVALKDSLFYTRSRLPIIIMTPIILIVVNLFRGGIYAPFSNYLAGTGPYVSKDTYIIILQLSGFLLGYLSVRNKKYNILAWQFAMQPIKTRYTSKHYLIGTISLALTLLTLFFVAYRGLPPNWGSIIKMLSGSSATAAHEIALYRTAFTKSYMLGKAYQGQGVFSLFQQIGWLICIGVSLACYKRWQGMTWRLCSVLFIFFGILTVTASGERAPAVRLLVFTVIIISLMYEIRLVTLLKLGLYFFVLIVILTIFSDKAQKTFWSATSIQVGAKQLTLQLSNRVFAANVLNDFRVIHYIDTGQLELGYGWQHVNKAILSLPGPMGDTPLQRTVALLAGARGAAYYTGTYISYAYADFGSLGVFFLSALNGLFASLIHGRVFCRKKNIESVTVVAFVIFLTSRLFEDCGIIALIPSMLVFSICYAIFIIPIKFSFHLRPYQ